MMSTRPTLPNLWCKIPACDHSSNANWKLAPHSRRGFTLLEILMAATAGVVIMAAIYGVFSQAIRLRNNATEQAREARLRARAAAVLRDDLRNAYISGGLMAASLEGSMSGQQSQFPGYLRFTTTTARDATGELTGDVQEVEYSVIADTSAPDRKAGLLVRTIHRDLLEQIQTVTDEEALLGGVEALEVEFFDGENWVDTWDLAESESELPAAIRVRIRQAPEAQTESARPPMEVLVPWTTQLPTATSSEATSGTIPAGSSSGTSTGGTPTSGGTSTGTSTP